MTNHFVQGTKRVRLERMIMYMCSKLFASCAVMLVFSIIIVGWNRYELSKLAANSGLLILFFPYAIAFSLIADWLASRAKQGRQFLLVMLYIAGGYLPFLVLSFRNSEFAFFFIAGTIGMLCSLAHLGLSCWVQRFSFYSIAATVGVAALTVYLVLGDFTVKKGVQESLTNTSYQASFDYFYGEHKVPIDLQEGTTLHYEVFWNEMKNGGYGHYMVDMKGRLVGRTASPDSNVLTLTVPKSGQYYFVLTGVRFEGKVRIEWRIEAANSSP